MAFSQSRTFYFGTLCAQAKLPQVF
uniref:Uncharacterized protein n=1 Tax=Anguilla anguilla TaxID=7936 RepID=A0A0E9UW91_ANGAN